VCLVCSRFAHGLAQKEQFLRRGAGERRTVQARCISRRSLLGCLYFDHASPVFARSPHAAPQIAWRSIPRGKAFTSSDFSAYSHPGGSPQGGGVLTGGGTSSSRLRRAAPWHCPRALPLASSINSQVLYREDMRARSKRRPKAAPNPMGFVDNIIAVAVYVVERSEGAMTKPLSRTKTHVRCGSPDCEWGVPFSGFSERQLDRCRSRVPTALHRPPRLMSRRHGTHLLVRLQAFTLTLLDDCLPTYSNTGRIWRK
jgi:hypothetical protein